MGWCLIKHRDNFILHMGISPPYPVAIRVVKLYEAEAITVEWGRINDMRVHALAKQTFYRF
jgi:hypothetical protein